MEKYTIVINDIATNTVIERDMTEEEKLNHISILNDMANAKAEAEAKAIAKAALLAQLGITEEQAKLLLS